MRLDLLHLSRRGLVASFGALSCALLAACSGDTTDPASLPVSQLYWAVQLNWDAVTLALTPGYDTVRLTATPLTALGTRLPGAGTIRYQPLDSTLTVDSMGLVTAHYTVGRTAVVATLTVGNLTHTDTAVFHVTNRPFAAPLATLSIQPQAGGLDSAKATVNDFGSPATVLIPVFATIATGNSATDTVCTARLCPFPVAFASSDSTVATVTRAGLVTPVYPGPVTIYASTLVYGVARRDSIVFTSGYPLYQVVFVCSAATVVTGHPCPVFSPPTTIIGGGGQVIMSNYYSDTVDVAFDDTTAVDSTSSFVFQGTPGGDFSGVSGSHFLFVGDTSQADIAQGANGNAVAFLTFLKRGTYPYHSRRLGASGTVIVRE